MSQQQQQESIAPNSTRTVELLPATTDALLSNIIATPETDTYKNFTVGVASQRPTTLLQSSINNNCPIGGSNETTIQSGDSGNILTLGTFHNSLAATAATEHSDQIIGRGKHNEATIDIGTAQCLDNSGDRAHDSWTIFDDKSGEENSSPVTSLDRVIIGSGAQQKTIASSGGAEVRAIALDSVAGGHHQLNRAKVPIGSRSAEAANLIQISDKASHSTSTDQSIAQLAHKSTSSNSTTAGLYSSADSKRLRFKSLLESAATSSTTTTTITSTNSNNTTICDSRPSTGLNTAPASHRISDCDRYELGTAIDREEIPLATLHEDTQEEDEHRSDSDDDDDEATTTTSPKLGRFESYSTKLNGRRVGSSYRKSTHRSLGGHALIKIQRLIGVINSKFIDNSNETPYVPYEGRDLLTGNSKYSNQRKRHLNTLGGSKTFRGSYKYSRAEISMAIIKKLIDLLFQKSTLALIGAFLIHITLGTVYTLSNINSYLTSYMRLHGSPTLTYGGSMWISSFYAVGQGFSMVLGGYLEKRFSARLSCFLGCLIHSGSIMCTSWTVSHGSLAVLMSYGFLPGFGCGLAYMTPMSNGFGWFPNRRGLVAGVILAGFGIGTFVFNIAQTAYVNPDNLSPPESSGGYFIQDSILSKVPGLFLFIGSIYAAMQFVGCCLLFKPPSGLEGKSLDERPILETEMSVGRAVKTREFAVLFVVYGIITQGVLFVNSMIKEYGQIFIGDDMYLAWTGSMASIANAMGRLCWGLAIDRYTFTQCFTCITCIFGLLMFVMPFEFVLSSKQLYLVCTLGIFGSFSGWMSTFPVHLSRTFGRLNSGMLYGLIFISQSLGGIASAFGAHYLIDHYTRFVPFFCVVFLEILGLAIYHLFYPRNRHL